MTIGCCGGGGGYIDAGALGVVETGEGDIRADAEFSDEGIKKKHPHSI